MDYKLIGQDFVPPDVDAKVRGKARYTEDMRVEGMLHCKLLTSPMPHARVRRIDAAAPRQLRTVHELRCHFPWGWCSNHAVQYSSGRCSCNITFHLDHSAGANQSAVLPFIPRRSAFAGH